ncbi:MAG TPA: alpha/beta hydrolase [Pseudomonadales bacterium]|nr:alpha/beta hydrolase [Pseudomonadales bacterium]
MTKYAVAILVALLLIVPFLIPVPPLTGTVDPITLADPDSRFGNVAGVHVHYKEAGVGAPAFVLLHGFGASVFTWRHVMGSFAERGRTVAYDRPAFGLTERPLQWSGENPYGDDAQIDIALALLDSLTIDRAVWVANSAGARVAVAVALRHRERVIALVLVDPAISGGPGWLRPLLRIPQLQHLGPLTVRSISDRGDAVVRRAWHDPTRVTADVLAGYRKPLRANDWDKALWEFTSAPRDSEMLRDVAGLATTPTLLITGDDDRIVPTQRTIDLAAKIPGSRLVVLPDCGHVPQEECPAPFMNSVREFLSSVATVP